MRRRFLIRNPAIDGLTVVVCTAIVAGLGSWCVINNRPWHDLAEFCAWGGIGFAILMILDSVLAWALVALDSTRRPTPSPKQCAAHSGAPKPK